MQSDRGAALLICDRLSAAYKNGADTNEVIKDFSMTIARGETVFLTGRSGSGKSTLALALMCLLNPKNATARGEIYFDGNRIDDLRTAALNNTLKNRMSMMFQDSNASLNPSMRVGAQISEAMIVNGKITKKEAKTRALKLLSELMLEDCESIYRSYPHELSGGMRQRAALAMAAGCEPELLILDEPTADVDSATESAVLEFIARQREQYNMSFLIITHKKSVLRALSGRTIDFEAENHAL